MHQVPPLIRQSLENAKRHYAAVVQALPSDGLAQFPALLWQARAAMTCGQKDVASELLRAAENGYGSMIVSDPAEFIAACIFCLNTEIMQPYLARIYPGLQGASFEICPETDSFCMQYPGVVNWHRLDGTSSKFYLGPDFWGEHSYLPLTRLISYFTVLSEYCLNPDSANGFVYINTADHGFGPGLTSSAPNGEFFLIPDPDYIGSRGYASIRAEFQKNDIPFQARRPVAVWRGASQGHSTSGWRGVPRIKLCLLAAQPANVGRMDCKLVAIVNSVALPESESDFVRDAGIMGDYIPTIAFLQYKYQIDVDGFTNAWAALFWKLLSGSPVIKIASEHRYRQWYYDRLEPWVNYVPAAPDLSDLIDKIRWLQTNEAVAEQIGLRGRELALSLDFKSQKKIMLKTIDRAIQSLARFQCLGSSLSGGLTSAKQRADLSEALRDGWSVIEDWGIWGIGQRHNLCLEDAGGHYLEVFCGCQLSALTKSNVVSLLVRNQVLATWQFNSATNFALRSVLLPAATEPLSLTFITETAIRPCDVDQSSSDDRQLGMALYWLRIVPLEKRL